jgi:hypothetical protein
MKYTTPLDPFHAQERMHRLIGIMSVAMIVIESVYNGKDFQLDKDGTRHHVSYDKHGNVFVFVEEPVPMTAFQERVAYLSGFDPHTQLRELLATIHRDGGHRVDEVGMAQAIAEAEQKFYPIRAIEDIKDHDCFGSVLDALLKPAGYRLERIDE